MNVERTKDMEHDHMRLNPSIITFRSLRIVVGILGITMGFAVVLLGFFQSCKIQDCISDYYYTNVQDFLVGVLIAVGVFLLCYRGYEKIDTVVNITTGICAIGVATFPDGFAAGKAGIFWLPGSVTMYVHLACAGLFFLLIGFNSMFLFTRTEREKNLQGVWCNQPMSVNKVARNKIYFWCGFIIFFCLVFDALCMTLLSKFVPAHISLVLETIMLVAFGVSWLIKGETLLKD